MSTINNEEIQKFSKLADEWWDVNGKFKPLHKFNPIRIEYITNNIKNHFKIEKNSNTFKCFWRLDTCKRYLYGFLHILYCCINSLFL